MRPCPELFPIAIIRPETLDEHRRLFVGYRTSDLQEQRLVPVDVFGGTRIREGAEKCELCDSRSYCHGLGGLAIRLPRASGRRRNVLSSKSVGARSVWPLRTTSSQIALLSDFDGFEATTSGTNFGADRGVVPNRRFFQAQSELIFSFSCSAKLRNDRPLDFHFSTWTFHRASASPGIVRDIVASRQNLASDDTPHENAVHRTLTLIYLPNELLPRT